MSLADRLIITPSLAAGVNEEQYVSLAARRRPIITIANLERRERKRKREREKERERERERERKRKTFQNLTIHLFWLMHETLKKQHQTKEGNSDSLSYAVNHLP